MASGRGCDAESKRFAERRMKRAARFSSVAMRRGPIAGAIRGLKPTATVIGSLLDRPEADTDSTRSGGMTDFLNKASIMRQNL